jgi:hypothetical protein
VIAARPEFLAPDVLTTAGFPPRAVSAVLAKLGGADRSTLAERLSEFLDGEAWAGLCLAMQGVVRGERREAFTWQGVQTPDNVWYEATMACLASPEVPDAIAMHWMHMPPTCLRNASEGRFASLYNYYITTI